METRHVSGRSQPGKTPLRPRSPRLFLLALLAGVTGCTAWPGTAPPRPRTDVAIARPRPEPRIRTTAWTFAARPGVCNASASDGEARLAVSVDGAGVGLSLASPALARGPRGDGTGALAFAGAEGEWRLPAERRGNGPLATQVPLDEAAAVHVLALIGGGALTAERGASSAATLRLPPGGAEGRAWFECVRRLLVT